MPICIDNQKDFDTALEACELYKGGMIKLAAGRYIAPEEFKSNISIIGQ